MPVSKLWWRFMGKLSRSQSKLWAFLIFSIGSSAYLGSVFSEKTLSQSLIEEQREQYKRGQIPNKEFLQAQDKMLATMIRDMANNRSNNKEWSTLLGGTSTYNAVEKKEANKLAKLADEQ
mmetsp:Transcript_8148/g.15761  ORF Transcript_8148/g.15761 Transcript_8148/m.15761 type:complete len:120 (-) Transcript_8148:55-414(-)